MGRLILPSVDLSFHEQQILLRSPNSGRMVFAKICRGCSWTLVFTHAHRHAAQQKNKQTHSDPRSAAGGSEAPGHLYQETENRLSGPVKATASNRNSCVWGGRRRGEDGGGERRRRERDIQRGGGKGGGAFHENKNTDAGYRSEGYRKAVTHVCANKTRNVKSTQTSRFLFVLPVFSLRFINVPVGASTHFATFIFEQIFYSLSFGRQFCFEVVIHFNP